MNWKRIHLAAPGGGAACGAHSRGAPKPKFEVMATLELALVDCAKCKHSSQWKAAINPAQYKLRLFTMHEGKRVLNPAFAPIKKEANG